MAHFAPAAFERAGEARRSAIASLRAIVPTAPARRAFARKPPAIAKKPRAFAKDPFVLIENKPPATAEFPIPFIKDAIALVSKGLTKAVAPTRTSKRRASMAASALRRPQVLAPGQALSLSHSQDPTHGMAQGSADPRTVTTGAPKRPLPAGDGGEGGASSDIVDLTDSPPYKRQHGGRTAHGVVDV